MTSGRIQRETKRDPFLTSIPASPWSHATSEPYLVVMKRQLATAFADGHRVLGLVNVADNTAVNSRVVQTANVRRSAIIPNLVGVAALYGAVASKRHQSIRTFA